MRVQRQRDVDGRQQAEDERLDQRHHDLEAGEADEGGEAEGQDHGEGRGLEQGDAQHAEGHEQDVTGEHVGEETDGQAERAEEEGREELDRGDQDVEGLGHAGREQRRLHEAAEALGLDADGDEGDPGDQRQDHRIGHACVGRHLEGRDDLEDVAEEDEEEHAQQEGEVLHALRPDRRHDDLLLDELDRALDDVLQAAGHEVLLRGEEEDRRDQHGEHADQGDFVEGVEVTLFTEVVRPFHEVLDGRELEGCQQ